MSEIWRVENDGGGRHWGMREVSGPSVRVVGFTSGLYITAEHANQVERDVHLIAAAPEMLNALGVIAATLPHIGGNERSVQTLMACINAAIEKATKATP